MDWLRQAAAVVLTCICVAQGVLVLLKRREAPQAVFATASFATAIAQALRLLIHNNMAYAAQLLSFTFLIAASVMLVFETVEYRKIILCLDIFALFLMGVLLTPMKQQTVLDHELLRTICASTHPPKNEELFQPHTPHLKNKELESTIVVPLHALEEQQLGWLVSASMSNTDCDYGTENWMQAPLRSSQQLHPDHPWHTRGSLANSDDTRFRVYRKEALLKSTLALEKIRKRHEIEDMSSIMEGLEDISSTPAFGQSAAMRHVSLQEWEAHKGSWMGSARLNSAGIPEVDAQRCFVQRGPDLQARHSAPSLHTYRQISETSSKPTTDLDTLARCTTPVQTHESTSSSPIKKVLGIFRKSVDLHVPSHQHTSLVVTARLFQASLASSASPKKWFKPKPLTHASIVDVPDWEDAANLDRSRVSSLPSAVIGEYDKEKWRKLKELRGPRT